MYNFGESLSMRQRLILYVYYRETKRNGEDRSWNLGRASAFTQLASIGKEVL